ncbi:ATP-binding cassette domain-containing protein [Clostridium botulinum D/C]|uniref:ABC transporter ATP-binding protein n=1 Tax=Clostridium botulinum TaxID=1491 RepID=UPI001E483D74|nr:ATP-binding cassette domain-containing protein [Clostridium botulinum]MCD3349475.1 ATP-binding cassette domain-containing protein [Clostridium botulinum D/C]MCD3358534.1 ATP-binding cassette domain-containing protein [Clostridium botulinum D/C]MCD3363288.1 ATP-binding cassette domain-containing protein [Clostridium botulinum D/C]MCD3364339.1 ATP-binding cassette domain-containing protein [Clostridium botulinum D/C]
MNEKLNEYGVKLANIHKKYGKYEVLKNLNIIFEKNTINVILGPSGCGKTTLLNIISGIEKQNSGEVLLIGDKISYIFQEDRLISWLNVYDNIAFVLKSTINKNHIDNIIMKYLKLVKLEEYKYKFPSELSGGMKRRVSIARALAYKSEILLMDEPFKGLDSELKKDIIRKFLKTWKEDKETVILVTHDEEEAMFITDRIYYLRDNKI